MQLLIETNQKKRTITVTRTNPGTGLDEVVLKAELDVRTVNETAALVAKQVGIALADEAAALSPESP